MRQDLGKIGLPAARRTDQHDVGLLQLDTIIVGSVILASQDPLVVVVDADAEDLLGLFLADDELLKLIVDVHGLGRIDVGRFSFLVI